MKRSLWEITEDLRALDQLIEEQGGEICEITDEISNEINLLLSTKADGCAEYVKSLEEQSESIDKRIEELKTLQKRIDGKREKFLSYVDICMRRINLEEAKGSFYRFSFRKAPPSVLITDENLIPVQFIVERVSISPDKKAILDALKKGEKVAGAEIAPEKKTLKMGLISTSKKKEVADE